MVNWTCKEKTSERRLCPTYVFPQIVSSISWIVSPLQYFPRQLFNLGSKKLPLCGNWVYENFHILHYQKRIVSAETIRGNTVFTYYSLVNRTRLEKFPTFLFYSLILKPQLICFLLSLFITEKFGQNDSRLDMAKTFIIVATMCTIVLPPLSA